MRDMLTFVTRFAADEPPLRGLPGSFIVVDAAELAAAVNRQLVDVRFIAVVNGAHLEIGWAQKCMDLRGDADVISPYVDLGTGPEEWYEPISPYAWFSTADAILMTGKLDERLTFGHHRLLAHRCAMLGLGMTHTPDVVATADNGDARTTALGTLYYKQIADANAVNELIGAHQ